MDKINELKHHPTAKGLLLSVSEDRGNPSLRLWDVTKGALLSTVPLPAGLVSSALVSPLLSIEVEADLALVSTAS